MAAEKDKKSVKKRNKNAPELGVAHIQATFNNTIVSITDLSGNVISWSATVMRHWGLISNDRNLQPCIR